MKYSLKFKTLIVVVMAALSSAIVSIGISYITFSDTIDNYYKETITNITKSAASLMNPDKIGLYADVLDKDEDYYEMMDILSKIKENSDISYLYIEKIVDDKAVAIMDTDRENPMRFRESFDISSGADTSELDKGIPAFISNEEGVGWMCSVFTPIIDSNGNTVALVGADISMNEVMAHRYRFLFTVCAAIFLVTLADSIILIYIISKMIVNPINRLSEAASNFVLLQKDDNMVMQDNSLISKLDIKCKDEVGNLIKSVQIMEKKIKIYISDLTAVTAEKERIGAELNVATQIQADMLPRIFPAFPEHSEFDIYATMHPAKEVGGDFYDFFMVDDEHLVMVMADVSGKGVPAALFMVIARTLIKNCAQTDSSPKDVLEKVNNQLCENNDAEMFVTVWIGFLNLSTGVLKAANAGHEYPVIKRAGGEFELFKDKHGFVLAGMEMTKYKEYEIVLNKNDVLFLYTDGVTESVNVYNKMYGTGRMLDVLNSNKDSEPKTLLEAVRNDIDVFVGDAPQFDDITMLAFELKDIKTPLSLTLIPDKNSFVKVFQFVESKLKEKGVSDKIINKINVSVDEIYSNIVNYSGADLVTVSCDVSAYQVTLVFEDNGLKYNPLDAPEPDITLSLDERQPGGLGIFLVKKSMDGLEYKYIDGKNVLIVTKKIV